MRLIGKAIAPEAFGDPAMGEVVCSLAGKRSAVVLANHRPGFADPLDPWYLTRATGSG